MVYLWSYYKFQRERHGVYLDAAPFLPQSSSNFEEEGEAEEIEDSLDFKDIFLLSAFFVLLFLGRSAIRFDFFFAFIAVAMGCHAFVSAFRVTGASKQVFVWLLCFLLIFELYAVGKHLPGFSLPEWFTSPAAVTFFALMASVGISIVALRYGLSNKRRFLRLGALATLVFLLVTLGGIAPFRWLGGHTDLSYVKGTKIRPVLTQKVADTFRWLEANTPQQSVIAAWWDYGSFINLLSDRATIIDEEQLPYWVHLMAREVFFAESFPQALGFLKAHRATHLLITAEDIQSLASISILASGKNMDCISSIVRFISAPEIIQSQYSGTIFLYAPVDDNSFPMEPIVINNGKYSPGAWRINKIYLKLNVADGNVDRILGALIETEIEDGVMRLKPQELYYRGIMYRQSGDVLPGTLLISSQHTDNPFRWKMIYVPPRARNTLVVRLYLLNEASDYFFPIYPSKLEEPQQDNTDGSNFSARIFKIRYPDQIPTDPRYLKTDFPEPELRRLWMEGTVGPWPRRKDVPNPGKKGEEVKNGERNIF